jgi:hypothetical protein
MTIRQYILQEVSMFNRRAPSFGKGDRILTLSPELQDAQTLSNASGVIAQEFLSLQKDATSTRQQYMKDMGAVQNDFIEKYVEVKINERFPEELDKLKKEMTTIDDEGNEEPPTMGQLNYAAREMRNNLEREEEKAIKGMMDKDPKKFDDMVLATDEAKIVNLGRKVSNLQMAIAATSTVQRTIESGILISRTLQDRADRKKIEARNFMKATDILKDLQDVQREGKEELDKIHQSLASLKESWEGGALIVNLIKNAFSKITKLFHKTEELKRRVKEI